MKESDIQATIRKALTAGKYGKFFRINVGTGVTGKKEWITKEKNVLVRPGDVVVRGARIFDTGAPVGFSDLIGVTPIMVTQQMIGQVLGVFVAIENKTETGKSSPEQEKFIKVIQSVGGRAGVARSVEDAIRIVSD
jgi:hypothetical protein